MYISKINQLYTQLQKELTLPSPVQKITSPWFLHGQNIDVFCKRDDLIHKTISGNKWRKLLPLIKHLLVLEQTHPKDAHKQKHILSFGGGYSNHLHALAYLCFRLNIKFTAVIRGNYSQSTSPMLDDIIKWQARCHYVTKIEYKKRTEPDYINALKQSLGADIVIPEGGSSLDCLSGVASLVDEYHQQLPTISHVVLPVASGGTMAGIIAAESIAAESIAAESIASENIATESTGQHKAFKSSQSSVPLSASTPKVIGIATLKNSQNYTESGQSEGIGYLENSVLNLLTAQHSSKPVLKDSWHIEHSFHHGGYAKSSPSLFEFMRTFTCETAIPLEMVYSGKCFFGLHQLIQQGHFPEKSRILAIHTGGLQGAREK